MIDLRRGQNGAQFIEKQVQTIASIYARAYNELVREINDRAGTLWQQKRAKELLVRVDDVIRSLDAQTRRFIDEKIPLVYRTFGAQMKADIARAGSPVVMGKQFSQIHQDAIKAVAEEGYLRFAESLQTVRRTTMGIITQERKLAIRETIAVGEVKGDTAIDIAKQIKSQVRADGITSLVDRAGHRWTLDRYSEMLGRQILANSSREAVHNVAMENDFDIVRFTRHGTTHAACARWEGERVSLTGKTPGFPTMDEAIADGMLHVGCLHGYFIDTDY